MLSITLLCKETKADSRKILFLGNSYIGVNDLPNTLKELALSLGDTLIVESNTPGGMTLSGHCSDANTLAKIQLGGWDYVVVQAQSQEPSFSPTQVATNTYPFAKTLDSLIHISNPCAETIFYMTWGRKNGDAGNCAAYPPVCTYEGMQQRLRESYLEMSQINNATCAPVGVAWKAMRDNSPGIELYNADESHPSIHGTYVVACTFYSSIYHKLSNGASYMPTGMLTWEALTIQNKCSNTVLDSLENWQQHGTLPFANFSSTNNLNIYTFSNASLRGTDYVWDFGDGSATSTQTNPTHTYNAIGTYTVTLKAKNTCGKVDEFKKSVNISVLLNVANQENNNGIKVAVSNHTLNIDNNIAANQIRLFDTSGKLLFENKLLQGINNIQLPLHLNGIFIYSILKKNKVLQRAQIHL